MKMLGAIISITFGLVILYVPMILILSVDTHADASSVTPVLIIMGIGLCLIMIGSLSIIKRMSVQRKEKEAKEKRAHMEYLKNRTQEQIIEDNERIEQEKFSREFEKRFQKERKKKPNTQEHFTYWNLYLKNKK